MDEEKEKKDLEKSTPPEEEKKGPDSEKTERRHVAQFGAAYAGPIPPSTELRRYEEILPGAADRILTMAEEERRDRNKNARHEVWLLYISRMFAQLMFTILSLGVISSGVYLVINGHSISGLVSIVTGLGVIGGSFFWSRQKSDDDSKDKEGE